MALNPGLAVRAVQTALKPSFGALFKQEMANAVLPAAMSSLFYGSQYYDPKDPVGSVAKVAGLVGTDLLGSAVLSAGIKRAFPKVTRGINPEYLDDVGKLGLKPGATAEQIAEAKKTKLLQIKDSNIADDLKKAQEESVISTASRLNNAGPERYFSDTVGTSGTGELLGNLANYGFSWMGMNNLVVQPLEQAGVLTPVAYQEMMEQSSNQGTTPQSEVIRQQMQNRYEQGVVNNAIVAPQTMSQLTAMEIERLLQQAAEEKEEMMVA
jgi:hypothetical protein